MKKTVYYSVLFFTITIINPSIATPTIPQCNTNSIGRSTQLFSPTIEANLRANEHAQQLEQIAIEIVELMAHAKTTDLVTAMEAKDLESVRKAMGVPEGALIDYELRLTTAVGNLLADFPELTLLMPNRPRVTDIQEATEELRRSADLLKQISLKAPALHPKIQSPPLNFKLGEGLQFWPPDTDPDPDPGDEDLPPPSVEPPPDDVDPDGELSEPSSCAWIPFIIGIAACGVGGSAAAAASFGMGSVVYGACAAHVYCDYCEGGTRNSICEP